MSGILTGFGVIVVLILIGILVKSTLPKTTTDAIHQGLTPTIYYITNPLLVAVLLAEADLRDVLGVYGPIAVITAALAAVLYTVIARFGFRLGMDRALPGAMASSYANAANMGLPIALFAVDSAVPAVSVVTAQLLILAPVYLTLFALVSRASATGARTGASIVRTVLKSVANPVTVGAAFGAVLSLVDWIPPKFLWEPLSMLGHASIPLLLMLFGMNLLTRKPFSTVAVLPEVILGVVVKLIAMPVLAWVVGVFVFGLADTELFSVVIMAALPSAQNVFLFATQFRLPTAAVTDITLSTSLLALPVVLAAGLVLAG